MKPCNDESKKRHISATVAVKYTEVQRAFVSEVIVGTSPNWNNREVRRVEKLYGKPN